MAQTASGAGNQNSKKDATEQKSSVKKKSGKKKNLLRIQVYIIILVFGICLLSVALIPMLTAEKKLAKELIYRIPTVSSTFAVNDQNEEILVNFVIKTDDSKEFEIDVISLQEMLTEIINTLSYNQIIESGGVDYLKEQVKTKLAESVYAGISDSLFVTDLQTGNLIEKDVTRSSSGQTYHDISARTLFKGLGKY